MYQCHKWEQIYNQYRHIFLNENRIDIDDSNTITNITSWLLSLKAQIKDIKIWLQKVRDWLCDEVGLEQYFELFVEFGFASLNAMKVVTLHVLSNVGAEEIILQIKYTYSNNGHYKLKT